MRFRSPEFIRITLFLLTAGFSFTCSFNKLFLRPTRLPAGAKKITVTRGTDSIVINFSGDTHQPVFLKNGNDTIVRDYTIESFSFKSSDGNLLNGWFLKPKNIVPTITLLHLHGNAGFLVYQYNAIAPLLKYGFQVFMFDYSGFGFSNGKATRTNTLADALSALDYVKSRPEIQSTKLVIYGQSYGGHLAAVVGGQRQNDIDGLVIEGGFSSAKDIAADEAWIFGRVLVKQGFCAMKSIANYHKPLLVIHSSEDNQVPFYLGKKLFDKANQPKEFYEIKKCHICGPAFYSDSISAKIKRMLK